MSEQSRNQNVPWSSGTMGSNTEGSHMLSFSLLG